MMIAKQPYRLLSSRGRSSVFISIAALVLGVVGCGSNGDDPSEDTESTESALETHVTLNYGRCHATFETNQSWVGLENNGKSDFVRVLATCRDWKGNYTIDRTNIQHASRESVTCYQRQPWWDQTVNWSELVALDICVGSDAVSCKRWRWRAPNLI
jgi:hypothetical protein